ncbi:type 4b pilus protein PilO2 [Undibacterium arcticum]
MFWQQLSSPRGYMAEARGIGKLRNWDVVAIRRGTRIQAGFVSKKIGAMKGMYSLAASLAGQLGPSWLGAFALADGRFAVVAVQDNSIVPGYDVILNRDEALHKLRECANLFHLPRRSNFFAPAEFQFAQREVDINELLKPKRLKADNKLKQLRFGLTGGELVTGLVLIAILIAAGVGFCSISGVSKSKKSTRTSDCDRTGTASRIKTSEREYKTEAIDAGACSSVGVLTKRTGFLLPTVGVSYRLRLLTSVDGSRIVRHAMLRESLSNTNEQLKGLRYKLLFERPAVSSLIFRNLGCSQPLQPSDVT